MSLTPPEHDLVPKTTAIEALLEQAGRQRLLRSVYVAARYGWPESPAPAWARRPQTFAPEQPERAAVLLARWTAVPEADSPAAIREQGDVA